MTRIEEHIEEHLRRLRSLRYSPRTIRQATFGLRNLAAWLASQGVTSPDALRARHLDNWLEALSSRMTGVGRPLKARSVNKQVEIAKGLLRHMASTGVVSSSLAARLQYVKEPSTLPGSVLTHAQVRRMLDAVVTDSAEGVRNRTMLELMYSSGVRVAELLGLDVDSFDLANRTAVVTGKGDKQRMVPFGREAARLLEAYLKAIRPHLVSDAAEKALFLDGSGKRLPYHTFRRIVHAVAEAAGLDVNVTPHTFRRSCTTELLRSGANMYHVKELLGHESLDTLKHYAKLTITDLKATHARCHPRERDGKERL